MLKQSIDSDLTYVIELAKQAAILEIESEKHGLESKKTIWIKMGSELESKNYPKHEIYTIIHKYLQEQLRELKKDNSIVLNSGWLYQTCKDNNWAKTSGQKIDNSSDLTPEVKGECVSERLKYIRFMDEIIERAKNNKELLKESYYYDLDEHGNEIEIKLNWSGFFELEGRSELFKLLSDMFYNEKKEWEQMVDSRQSILPRMRFIITALTSVVTNKDLCTNYYARVKSILTVTPKKLTQFLADVFTTGEMSGKTSNSRSQLFDLVKEDSMLWNFIDIECPECHEKGLRIKMLEGGVWKFVCKNWNYHKTDEAYFPATLFSDRIKQLQLNSGGLSTKYLNKQGISVKSN